MQTKQTPRLSKTVRSILLLGAASLSLAFTIPGCPNMDELNEKRQQVGQRQPAPLPEGMPRAVPLEPGAADRMRRHLEDMQRLMERMQDEMQAIDE